MRVRTLLILGLFFFCASLMAQENRAAISGLVTDPTGAAIPGAKVLVVSVERNTRTEVDTTDTGRYVVNFLNPGLYTLSVERAGFKKHVQKEITLVTGDKLGLDVVLEVGQLSDSV
ncbi:MAG: carboxypeptidase-like regulatory domain-containing protein, partial [Acidobacteria bacterium]|nr:carboxypeptidase-like regulatory domain-containing protein [Acidobacteriota bacterium]